MQKLVVGSIVLVLCTLGWHGNGLGEQIPAPRGELRIVDSSSDNFVTVVFNVFEHLVDLEAGGKPVPRLATGWHWVDDHTLEMTLRQGVTFHNGEPFDAAVVQLNWDEDTHLQQPFRSGQFLNFKPGSWLEILDPYTIRFHFPAPDGAALVKLSSMHIGSRQFWAEHGWGEQSW
jgi:peptide/nickel transport system substrate-binding protein